jgi:hypothetical protein
MNIPECRSPRTLVRNERAGEHIAVVDGFLSAEQRTTFYFDSGIFRYVRVGDEGYVSYGVLQRRTFRNARITREDEVDGIPFQR